MPLGGIFCLDPNCARAARKASRRNHHAENQHLKYHRWLVALVENTVQVDPSLSLDEIARMLIRLLPGESAAVLVSRRPANH